MQGDEENTFDSWANLHYFVDSLGYCNDTDLIMKQNISPEQMKELTDSQHNELRDWVKKTKFYVGGAHISSTDNKLYGLMSIGQMIEFINDNTSELNEKGDRFIGWKIDDTFCDALWEAVKEKLNEL